MVYYSRILQTGVQSLLAVACGWCCGHWEVVDAEPTVQYTNTLVLRFCIPCLQIWLLAVKTDMQRADNWRALAAFLLWSLGLQALLVIHQAVTKQRLQLDRLGVDGLILTTNNTGILGPVVLEAAVGAHYAPLGMLATIVLYFQQLPLAELLFHFHKQQQHPHSCSSDPAAAAQLHAASGHGLGVTPGDKQNGHKKVATSPVPCDAAQEQHRPQELRGSHSDLGLAHAGNVRHLHHKTTDGQGLSQPRPGNSSSNSSQAELQQLGILQANSRHHLDGAATGVDSQGRRQHRHKLSWDLEQQHQHQGLQMSAAADVEGESLLPAGILQRQQEQGQSMALYALSLLLKNPLVWSTAVAVLLSALGSAALLDPSSPLSLKHLAFLEALLGWFAQTTAPLTLFTTGLWMYSNSQQQQQQQQQQRHNQGQASNSTSSSSSSSSERKAVHTLPYGSQEVAWSEVFVYLLLRATVAPGLMVVVCHLMGFRGDLAHALVILSLLPVAQTAFVVCKQAETGMAAVSVMLVASLFMMLPQLMVVLAVLERLGALTGET